MNWADILCVGEREVGIVRGNIRHRGERGTQRHRKHVRKILIVINDLTRASFIHGENCYLKPP